MMRRWLGVVVSVVVRLALAVAEDGACVEYIPLHKVFTHPTNTMAFSHGRVIRGDRYSIGGCETLREHESGSELRGNITILSLNHNGNSEDCLLTRNKNGDLVFRSMQALILRTNGFLMDVASIDLADIDSEVGVPVHRAAKESTTVFGMSEGQYVPPSLMLYENSVIEPREYLIPSSAMFDLGFSRQHMYVKGVQFSADTVHDCRSSEKKDDYERCQATASFSKGIDTLVVLHALAQRPLHVTSSLGFVSELRLKCN